MSTEAESTLRKKIRSTLERHWHDYDRDCLQDFGCDGCDVNYNDAEDEKLAHAQHLTDLVMSLLWNSDADENGPWPEPFPPRPRRLMPLPHVCSDPCACRARSEAGGDVD